MFLKLDEGLSSWPALVQIPKRIVTNKTIMVTQQQPGALSVRLSHSTVRYIILVNSIKTLAPPTISCL